MASPPSVADLIVAARRGNLSLIQSFAQCRDQNGYEAAEQLVQIAEKNGKNLLHHAASMGRTQICKYFVEILKFDVDIKDDAGNTPLHYAAMENQHLTSAYLLDHGANPNAMDLKGSTPLHLAAEKGGKELLRLLISKGAEVNAESFDGTPLQRAVATNMKEAVKILLVHGGANLNLFNRQTNSPLVTAIIETHVDCVRLLLKHKADPNLKTRRLSTPLTVAAAAGDIEIIKCLLKAGANPNATNFHDCTPIEVAAMRRHRNVVTALFPCTTPIPYFAVWSVDGILDYASSQDNVNRIIMKGREKRIEAKAKGNEAVKRKEYFDALCWYDEALETDPWNAEVLSNRSLCWARLNEGDLALKDAEACIKRSKGWSKGYYRAGVAWSIKKDIKQAAESFLKGLKKEPRNKELQDAYRSAMAELGVTTIDLDAQLNEVSLDDDDGDEDNECPLCTMFNCHR